MRRGVGSAGGPAEGGKVSNSGVLDRKLRALQDWRAPADVSAGPTRTAHTHCARAAGSDGLGKAVPGELPNVKKELAV